MRKSTYLFKGIPALCLVWGSILSPAQSLPEQITISEEEDRLYTGGVISQDFYDESKIRSVYLDFYHEGFWEEMKENFGTDKYVVASMRYEGESFDSVAVTFKGQTSYTKAEEQGSEKLSFSVKLDEIIEGQDIDSYNNLNFNNAFQDASFMKEVLYARLSRDHLPSLRGNFIRLYLNGEDWGLYANIQQLNGDFIKQWFISNDGIRWRADAPPVSSETTKQINGTDEPPSPGGQWGDGTAALNYLGDTVENYQLYYTLKDAEMENPWSYLLKVCEVLNNTPLESISDSLAVYMDLDATLWFLAQEILFSDDDSYVNKGKMDYYLYVDKETGRMVPLEFDGNSAMNMRNVAWSPFLNEEDLNYPLMNRLLAVPELRSRYIAHAKTLLELAFDPGHANSIIDQYDALVAPQLQTDPKIDFIMATHDRVVSKLRTFITERRSVILSYPEFSSEAPLIGMVDRSSTEAPHADEEAEVRATATHSKGIREVRLYYGTGFKGTFSSVAMNDAGSGADELAGDGTFTGSIPPFPAGTWVRYYVEARANGDDPVASYMPKGAEYDVYLYQVAPQESEVTQLVINEFMASNDQNQADEAGEYDDWIEIHNLSGEIRQLEGFHLSDDGTDPRKWTFPETSIDPGEYLVIWADDDENQGSLHANFKISSDGEELVLSDLLGNCIDQVSFPEQEADISFGRWPDGTGPFTSMQATFGAANDLYLTHLDESSDNMGFLAYPNPCKGLLHVSSPDNPAGILSIYTLTGIRVFQGSASEIVDVSHLSPGMYLLKQGIHSQLISIIQ